MFFSKLFILTQLGAYSIPVLILVLILLLIVAAAFAYLLIKAFTQQSATKLAPYKTHWTMQAPIWILFVCIIGIGVYLAGDLSIMLNNITVSLGF